MTPVPPAVEAFESKRTAILDAARRLLVRHGFQDIVLDEVAKAADVAKGTLYLYFKNKEDLFSAAFEDLVDQLGVTLDGVLAGGKEGEALLAQTVKTVLSHMDRNRDFISQFTAGRLPSCGPKATSRLFERFGRNVDRIERILERCRRTGLDLPGAGRYAAHSLFGLCRSAMIHNSVSGLKAPLADRTEDVVSFFLYGAKGAR